MSTTMTQSMGVLASQAIGQYLKKAQGYEKAVLKNRDPEDLHQMRVNMRRLRTVMQVFAPGIVLPKAGSESPVAAFSRQLGNLRDLDVVEATLRQRYLPDLPEAEGKALQPVFDHLQKCRKKAFTHVKKALKGDRYAALKATLEDWTAHPVYTPIAAQSLEILLPDLMLPLLSQLWLHPGWLVGTQGSQDTGKPDEALTLEAVDTWVRDHSRVLHSLRKQVKRVRYQLRVVADLYGDRLNADLENFSTLQETLGQLQDSWVLADFLRAGLTNWEADLPTLKALLVNSRHHAWMQWQGLQAHYLDPKHRHALRQTLMQPGVDAKLPEPKATQPTPRRTTKTGAAPKPKSTKATSDQPAAPPKLESGE